MKRPEGVGEGGATLKQTKGHSLTRGVELWSSKSNYLEGKKRGMQKPPLQVSTQLAV